jgi:tetratricopeptide (TPR) repeat protein
MHDASARSEQAARAAAQALQAGDSMAAERLAREALAADANHVPGLLLLAVIEHARQDDEAAASLLQRAISVQPELPDGHALLGQVLRTLQRHDEALAAWDRALQLRPDRADVLFNRGNLLRELGRAEEALACYERALAIAPDDAAILNNQAVALQLLGRHEASLATLARVLAVQPDEPDALHNRGIALEGMGRHELALQAFDAVLARDPAHPHARMQRGIVLQAMGRSDEALACYDEALRIAPAPETYQNRAALLLARKRAADALEDCERALRLRPGFVQALTTRGEALQVLGRAAEALESHRAAQLQQRTAEGALGMGDALLALERATDALGCYDEAVALRPESLQAWNNRGNALQALNRHEEALESHARAIALRPHDAEAHWNAALARLALGDLREGWREYEWRWQHQGLKLPARADAAKAWNGEPGIAGRTMLLYPEQGFGDAIQFVRYAPRVAALGARVALACHESLRELFGTVPGVEHVIGPEEAMPAFDLHAPLMSLPHAFGTELASIPADVPYLSADAAEVARWRERLATLPGRRKIGFAWSGNPEFAAAQAKRCPLPVLMPLLAGTRRLAVERSETPAISFVSLQTGAAAAELAQIAGAAAVADWTHELTSFARTAALICALDLVITIDTAVAHLAGALGKPVWILLPFAADWRWLRGRADSPWYPTARLFRQPRIGDWESVVREVAAAL